MRTRVHFISLRRISQSDLAVSARRTHPCTHTTYLFTSYLCVVSFFFKNREFRGFTFILTTTILHIHPSPTPMHLSPPPRTLTLTLPLPYTDPCPYPHPPHHRRSNAVHRQEDRCREAARRQNGSAARRVCKERHQPVSALPSIVLVGKGQ